MPLMARVGLGDKLLREGCRPVVRDDVTRARQRDDDVVALHFHVEVVGICHPPILAQKNSAADEAVNAPAKPPSEPARVVGLSPVFCYSGPQGVRSDI
jgi:hypothetical protein